MVADGTGDRVRRECNRRCGESLAGHRSGRGATVAGAARRVSEALESVGSPLGAKAVEAIEAGGDDRAVTKAVQEALDPLCLAAVTVRKDGSVNAVARGGRPVLVEHGWRTYLVKVLNEAGAKATLNVQSPNARPVPGGPRDEIGKRWLELSMYDERPMTPRLSGLGLEYRIVQLFSRDAGAREAMLWFDLAGRAGRPERGS